jgi:hypothetical protein
MSSSCVHTIESQYCLVIPLLEVWKFSLAHDKVFEPKKKPKYSLRSSLEPKGIAISREAMWYPPVMFVGSSSHATTMIYWP